jgi:uncharacterized membrane protein
MPSIESAETGLVPIVRGIRLVLEAMGAFWIGVGFLVTMVELVVAFTRLRIASFTGIRLTFGRYLSLALEFQLASDILSTSIAPSWQEIGKLGATAVIRTALNYFLTREIDEYREKQRNEIRASKPADPLEQGNV